LLDGLDISDEIRGSLVTNEVSTVSAHPGVREVLVAKQRLWASQHGGAVVEGRDIGTVVFPDALVKVFLTASDAERARRRVIDEASAGREANFAEVEADLARRDAIDSGRSVSPLIEAQDALKLDSTTMTIDEVVETIVSEFLTREALQ
jgi:cytidylate kinase